MDDTKKAICCGCSILASISIVIMVILSIGSLEASQMGLKYSIITKAVEREPYPSGFHYIGFGQSFIKFDSVSQTMEFSGV
jgi:hypothetical protein